MDSAELYSLVKAFWEEEVCGTRYGLDTDPKRYLDEIEQARYELEPHIPLFANFAAFTGKRVLEIGVGGGVDFQNWSKNGARVTGIDFTESSILLTQKRLILNGCGFGNYTLCMANAETLPFRSNQFDLVYSWGVLHHTPKTEDAFKEAFRVLKPGGIVKAMIYHVPSVVGYLLWIRYCLLKGKIFATAKEAIFNNVESPGTKAYTLLEAQEMLSRIGFYDIKLTTKLSHGDLLNIKPSKKYSSLLYRIIWKLYPRWLVKMIGDKYGLELLIEAKKP